MAPSNVRSLAWYDNDENGDNDDNDCVDVLCGQAFATERAVHEILQRKVLLPHTSLTQGKNHDSCFHRFAVLVVCDVWCRSRSSAWHR